MTLRAAFLLVVVLLVSDFMEAQIVTKKTPRPPAKPTPQVRRYQSKSIIVSGGFGIPLSHGGVTDYWRGGLMGSVKFMVGINRNTAIGLGLDGSSLYFRRGGFASTNPGVAVQARNIGFLSLYLAATYTPVPGRRFMPFVEGDIGVGRVTAAVYQEVLNGVRITYYSLPGTMRLCLGAGVGADLVLTRWMAFRSEVKFTYLHNDPDMGIGLGLSGGFRFNL